IPCHGFHLRNLPGVSSASRSPGAVSLASPAPTTAPAPAGMRCRADTLVRTISVGPTNWYGFPKRDAVHDAVKKKRYSNSRSRNLLPSLHDAFDNFIRVFFQDFFPVLCPVTASGLVDLEEPDCIIRPKFLHQYVEAFLLDLMQCFGAHHFPSFNLVTGFSICTCMFRCDLKN